MASSVVREDELTRRWRFAPRPSSLSRDELAQFRSRAEAALRSGHGVDAHFALVICSGREPELLFEGIGPATVRWADRVLPVVYGSSCWEPGGPRRGSPALPRAVARRRRLPGEREGVHSEVGEVMGALAMAFSAVGPGVELRCDLSPIPSPVHRPWWDLTSGSPPVRPPERAFPAARGPLRPSFPPRTPALDLLWSARLTVEAGEGIPEERWRMAIRATEAAWRSLDGEGVELSPFRSRLGLEGRFCLSASELVALLPRPDLPVVGNARGVRGADLLGLGRSHAGTTVAVPVEPDQGRHLAVLGETGMGKSSLLVALAVRAAALGGLVLLDPLGETAQAVARELDGERTRLLWIAPGPGAPGLNALEGIHPGSIRDRVRSERRTSDLVHALRRVRSGRYEESAFWGPRLEEMLTRAVRAAAAFPGATLADAHTLLSTTGLTRQRTPPGAEEVVGELALRIRQRPDDADGARRLLHEVVRNPTLEQMICARTPTLSPRELIAPGRIVLISGRASVVGESTARYLLAVYLALLWSELLASDDPQKTFVFLDEAQWFAHESLSEMLRLARRRNVHVVLATQSIASLPESVQEAVWTNVADLVAFRGSPEEAREIARVAPSITPEVLLSLPRGEAVAMVGKGRSVQSIRTARIPCRSSAGDAPSLPRSPPIDPANVRGENAIGGFGFGASAGIPEPVEGEWRSLEEVLGFLRANACSSAPGRAVRVVVSDLQRRAPGRPDLIRQVGASLGRSGALMRRERTPEGTVWWIDSGRLDQIGPIDPEKGGLLLAPTEAGGDPRPSAGGANRESNSASGPGRPGGPPAAGMAPQPKPS